MRIPFILFFSHGVSLQPSLTEDFFFYLFDLGGALTKVRLNSRRYHTAEESFPRFRIISSVVLGN